MAWGSAHGWDAPTFRVYYLAGALLSAPLLGIGSLQLNGRRWAGPLGLIYVGLAVGVAAAMPVHGVFSSTDVPHAQDHVDVFPRILAIAGSSLGTLAVVLVAAATLKRRPLGNALLVAAVAAAAGASALTQTAVAAAAAGFALAAGLLYASAPALGVGRLHRVPRDDTVGECSSLFLVLASGERLRAHITEVPSDLRRPLAAASAFARVAPGKRRRRRRVLDRRRR